MYECQPLQSMPSITHNLFRQFWNVTFNEIFCKLVLFLFYGTPAEFRIQNSEFKWPEQNLTADSG